MYITINDVVGEKMIDLSYPINSFKQRKEIAVISRLSNNIQYKVEKAFTFIPPISPGDKKLISSRPYAGRELIFFLGMVDLTDLVNDARVIKTNELRGITEMIINMNKLDNTNNLENGKPSNALLTYHVTDDKDFTSFEPKAPQYKELKKESLLS